MNNLTISQAIEGFLLEKEAQRLSSHTLSDYNNAFRKLLNFLGNADVPINDITAEQIKRLLLELGTVPQEPGGVAPRPAKSLSKKTILNIHTAYSSLWTWATKEGYADRHIIRGIPRPDPDKKDINPLSQQDVRALLAACERSRSYSRPGKRECSNARPTAERDKAILLLLLDTGVRASELCDLTIGDVDLQNRRIRVFGKGSKERFLPISPSTAKSVWRYITKQHEKELPDTNLLGKDGDDFSRYALGRLLHRLSQRAGVSNVYPHRFRDTFATNFLRNGGHLLALQAALGHSSLEMVRLYAAFVQADLDAAHKTASPVANWRL
jgi:integrase/recombinase XerD